MSILLQYRDPEGGMGGTVSWRSSRQRCVWGGISRSDQLLMIFCTMRSFFSVLSAMFYINDKTESMKIFLLRLYVIILTEYVSGLKSDMNVNWLYTKKINVVQCYWLDWITLSQVLLSYIIFFPDIWGFFCYSNCIKCCILEMSICKYK